MALRIGIAGITGRMGHEIAALAANNRQLALIGGLSRRARTTEPGTDGVRLFGDAADLLPEIQVLIDPPSCRWSAARPVSTPARWRTCARLHGESRSSMRPT